MKRTRISDRTLLAHCLARLFEIPHAHQVLMHEDQVISLFHRDHWPIPFAEGGTNHFSNVWARLIADHLHKTRTVDVPGIAKRKRIRRSEEMTQHLRRILGDGPLPPMSLAEERQQEKRDRDMRRIPSRPFGQGQRKLESRNTFKRRGQ